MNDALGFPLVDLRLKGPKGISRRNRQYLGGVINNGGRRQVSERMRAVVGFLVARLTGGAATPRTKATGIKDGGLKVNGLLAVALAVAGKELGTRESGDSTTNHRHRLGCRRYIYLGLWLVLFVGIVVVVVVVVVVVGIGPNRSRSKRLTVGPQVRS